MKSVLTLIASSCQLTDELVEKISKNIASNSAIVINTDWLSENACDIYFSKIDPSIAEKLAQEIIADLPIDYIAQYTENREKKLLISDMDSTIITIECIDEIADFAGVKEQVSAITERAMRGEIDFIAALNERVGLLKGLPETTLQQVYNERLKFMSGAKELVATMRKFGAYTVLVSGGFDFFTARVAHELGFHENSANSLEIIDGKLTGKAIPPILDKQAKLNSLMQISQQRRISTSDVLAVGDGANDLPMIVAAGLGVAYHAKPLVQQSARAKINHNDLTALLYAQGYRKNEWVL